MFELSKTCDYTQVKIILPKRNKFKLYRDTCLILEGKGENVILTLTAGNYRLQHFKGIFLSEIIVFTLLDNDSKIIDLTS